MQKQGDQKVIVAIHVPDIGSLDSGYSYAFEERG